MGITLEELVIVLRAENAELKKGMDEAKAKTKQATQSIQGDLKKMALRFGTLAGVILLARKAFRMFNEERKGLDALAKTARRLGIAANELRNLQFAAKLTGVQTNTLNMALQRMTRRVAEAAAGTGEAKAALKELNLDARELAALPLEEAFAEIAQAMRGVEGDSDKVRLAFKLFDSEGVALLNTLGVGKEGLEEYRKEANKLGGVLTEQGIAKVERLNDAVTRMDTAWRGAKQQIVTELAPALTDLADGLTAIIKPLAFAAKLNVFLQAPKMIIEQGRVFLEGIGALEAQVAETAAKTTDIIKDNITQRTNAWLQAHKTMFANASWFFGQIQGMLATAGEGNRELFELNKGIAIANAVVNVAQGVTKAFAHFGPFAWPAAAAIAAAGAVQIAAISKTSPGGGASAPPAPAAAPAAGGGGGGSVSNVHVVLSGESFGRDQVLGLIEQINEASDDGARLNVRAA